MHILDKIQLFLYLADEKHVCIVPARQLMTSNFMLHCIFFLFFLCFFFILDIFLHLGLLYTIFRIWFAVVQAESVKNIIVELKT